MPKNLDDPRGVGGGGAALVLDTSAVPAPVDKLPALACYHTADSPADRNTGGAMWQSAITMVVFVDWADAYDADRALNERLWALRMAAERDFRLGGRVLAATIQTIRREPRITSISGYLTRTAEVVWAVTTGVSTD